MRLSLYFRSDQGSGYHGVKVVSALPTLAKKNKTPLHRYDYSAAQDGKSSCDRKTAHLKFAITR